MIPDIGRISGRYIQKLADTVREIEASSGEATQLLVVSGGKKQCIIGDLTTRRGKYELVMDATYVAPLGDSVSHIGQRRLASKAKPAVDFIPRKSPNLERLSKSY